jgi:prolipoprotein diacylglyceryltransferase
VHPTLFDVALYYPILGLSVVAQIVLLLWLIHRAGFAARRSLLYIALLCVFGFLGAKGFSIIFHGGVRPLATEAVTGYRYPGALIGILGFGYLLRRLLPAGLSYAHFLDLWAPSFALSCGLGRLGCFVTGCCYGSVCYLPWAIRYPRGSIPWWEHYHQHTIAPAANASLPVHPFPIYLFLMEMALLWMTLAWQKRKAYDGQVVLVFLTVHGFGKFLLEYFRHPYNVLHQFVLPIAIVSGTILVWRWYAARGTGGATEMAPRLQG